MLNDILLLEVLTSQCSKNTLKCQQSFMKHFVQNVIHDNKDFDDIILLEFLTSQRSNNTSKWEM